MFVVVMPRRERERERGARCDVISIEDRHQGSEAKGLFSRNTVDYFLLSPVFGWMDCRAVALRSFVRTCCCGASASQKTVNSVQYERVLLAKSKRDSVSGGTHVFVMR